MTAGKRTCKSCLWVCLYGHVTGGCDHPREVRTCKHVTWNDTGEQCDTQQIRQLTEAEEAAYHLGGDKAICYALPVPLVAE